MHTPIELTRAAKLPKRRKPRPLISPALRQVWNAYERYYKIVYKRTPQLRFDCGYTHIDGNDGVGLKRLKELTRMLKDKAKDLT